MPNPLVSKRNTVNNFEENIVLEKSLLFWCPGCDKVHRIVYWSNNEKETWTWDGNEEAPTISPSILVYGSANGGNCHSFIRNGKWEFLADSNHSLAGQTVDMVPLPDWLVKE